MGVLEVVLGGDVRPDLVVGRLVAFGREVVRLRRLQPRRYERLPLEARLLVLPVLLGSVPGEAGFPILVKVATGPGVVARQVVSVTGYERAKMQGWVNFDSMKLNFFAE